MRATTNVARWPTVAIVGLSVMLASACASLGVRTEKNLTVCMLQKYTNPPLGIVLVYGFKISAARRIKCGPRKRATGDVGLPGYLRIGEPVFVEKTFDLVRHCPIGILLRFNVRSLWRLKTGGIISKNCRR